jgi:hypothetical protein
MTVHDLRAKLSKADGKEEVVVCWEDEHREMHFFGIDEVSLRRGTLRRLPNEKFAVTSNRSGPECLFIGISPEPSPSQSLGNG